jgi:hypothetical protein
MFTIKTALHEAFCDPMTGEARLVMPRPWDDLDSPAGGESLHTSDGLLILARMQAEWGVVSAYDANDEAGDPWEHVGYRADGREVVALYGVNPLLDTLTDEEIEAAGAVLDALAGLIPAQRVA